MIDIMSSYFQYRKETEFFTQEIARINSQLNNKLIFGVYANAFSPQWGDPRRNEKGRMVEQLIIEMGLSVENTPNTGWSFHGSRGNSNVDITLSRGLTGRIRQWGMDAHSITSDHSLISFLLADAFTVTHPVYKQRYDDRKINSSLLRNKISENLATRDREAPVNVLNPTTLDNSAALLTRAIVDTCNQVLGCRKRAKASFPPWWNSEVNKSRQRVKRAHRTMVRSGEPMDRVLFKTARNSHVALIRKSKKDCWINFVQQQPLGSNKWGKLTKWLINGTKVPSLPTVLQKTDNTYTTDFEDTIVYLMNELIPNSPNDPAPPAANSRSGNNGSSGLKIAYDDLKSIVWRQKNRAPGADGITIKIIKAAWPAIDTRLLRIVNKCLDERSFPLCWKNAEVVVLLINKDKGPLRAKSYRPVSLLPVLGKILEEVVCDLGS